MHSRAKFLFHSLNQRKIQIRASLCMHRWLMPRAKSEMYCDCKAFITIPKACLCSWNKVQPPQSLINSPSVPPFHQWVLFFSKCGGWRGNLKASESSFTVCWLCRSHGASSPHVGQIKVQAPFAPWQRLLHGNKCGRECERVILPFYRCWCATSELPHQKSLSSLECCLAKMHI